jgi:hypothetical protein
MKDDIIMLRLSRKEKRSDRSGVVVVVESAATIRMILNIT